MASIERTAYPRFSRIFTSRELQDVYTPSVEDILFARLQIRNDANLLCFVVLLKCFQRLQYFPPLSSVPTPVVDYIRSCLHLPPDLPLGCDQSRTLYRYHSTIREHLNVKGFKGKEARHIAVRAAYRAAEVMDQQTDLINATIDELVRQKYELPAFSHFIPPGTPSSNGHHSQPEQRKRNRLRHRSRLETGDLDAAH